MKREEIVEKLNVIFRDVFDDESIQVTEQTTANDIASWDSLMHITLIASIESEFHFKFGMKDILGMKNTGEMIDLIERAI